MSSRRLRMVVAVVVVAVVILGAAIATAARLVRAPRRRSTARRPVARSTRDGRSSRRRAWTRRLVWSLRPGFSTADWFPVTLPSTVLAGLVANGEYDDLYVGTNLEDVWAPRFEVPWWYRTEFELDDEPGARTQLHFDGINYRADIYVNGTRVADRDRVAGTFRTYAFDVTDLVHTGTNAVAVARLSGRCRTTTSRSRGSTGARSRPTAAWGSGTTSG